MTGTLIAWAWFVGLFGVSYYTVKAKWLPDGERKMLVGMCFFVWPILLTVYLVIGIGYCWMKWCFLGERDK